MLAGKGFVGIGDPIIATRVGGGVKKFLHPSGYLSIICFLKHGPLFHLISSFSHSNINYNFNDANWKKVDGVLGIQT